MNRSQTWRSNTDSHDSISSISSSPPAYYDASTKRSRSPQPLRLTSSLPAQPATSTSLNTNSIADNASWSSILPRRPRNEGSTTPSTSAIRDSDTMTYLSLVPPSHSRDLSLPTGKFGFCLILRGSSFQAASTQSVIAASRSSTYSSQFPRMPSVDESGSDTQPTRSGIQHDSSTITGMMISFRHLIAANVFS
jgi:hypothetical protein